MKKAYPVILTPLDDGYMVTVPDLEINTQGDDIADAIEMARDAIGLWAICTQDAGRIVPSPSKTMPIAGHDDIVTFVDIDFDEYRKENDTTAVRASVSLPRNLKIKAEAAGLSFSRELQTRLKEVLNV